MYLNTGYFDSVDQLLNHLTPIIFGFQTLKIELCVSAYGDGPSLLFEQRVCRKNGEIMLCDTDVSQGNHIQKVEESLQRPHSLV
jgi:hypothetical protein